MISILHKLAEFNKTNKTITDVCNKYKSHILGVDHIAFRSLYKGMNKFDTGLYKKKDQIYNFPEYSVKANEYYKIQHNADDYPLRIFSSYYIPIEDGYNYSIRKMIYSLQHNNFGEMYSYNDYIKIYNYNQYLAWTMLHKNTINHVAFQVDDIEKVTNMMIDDGHVFSKSNGNVFNISPDGDLLQTSLVSIKKDYQFIDGHYNVPYTFLEFVERRNGREGFSESNATKIIYSTKNM